ncbi:MAG: histone deacetylase [Acidimicrobiia bacterium]|nr:histone deacetylase [Acidimicrobiia bacterium]
MLLVSSDPSFVAHDTGRGHPERAGRLAAVARGIEAAGLRDAVVELEPRAATSAEMARVHDPTYLAAVERFCEAGGGMVDPDTVASVDSWTAATHAAGAGLEAVEVLSEGRGDAAFLAVRPPGHHASASTARGFCLVNSAAVTAAALRAAGERVVIIDWDAHHGNGTQDLFWNDPGVLYVSAHEFPLFPHTGRLDETGGPDAPGTTCNIPVPAGTTGDVYLAAFDDVVEPLVERFAPDWTVVSAGFDAHRRDPLTGLALSSGDFAALAERVARWTPGRIVAFLEGGYDEQALVESTAVTVAALLSEQRVIGTGHVGGPAETEPPTTGGPGRDVVEATRRIHATIREESEKFDH